MVRVRLLEHGLEREHLGQVRHQPACLGIGKPEAVVKAVTRMAVQRQAEGPARQLLSHHVQQGRAFDFHGRAGSAAIPGQQRTEGLPAGEKRHAAFGLLRRVAHQVHAVRVGAFVRPHAARVDDGHEHQPHLAQLLVQQLVPFEAEQQCPHPGQDQLGADALQAVDAAEKSDRGRPRVARTDAGGVQRERGVAGAYLAHRLNVEMRAAGQQDGLELFMLGKGGGAVGRARQTGEVKTAGRRAQKVHISILTQRCDKTMCGAACGGRFGVAMKKIAACARPYWAGG